MYVQTFPYAYIYYENTMSIGRQISNAIPVKLTKPKKPKKLKKPYVKGSINCSFGKFMLPLVF
ncbi:hypothetical protein TS65_18355 [Aneurinibacillus migulanus]|nr:hypothetical protein TS65_18355 [Aneurinibacillus migulanus]GED13357.1 hypothetical protein AMI01nite_13480 [Aneurinibacillus migulanus]